MSYGNHRWTCGECGDSYEASGSFGGYDVGRWAREHKEKHRVDKLPQAERAAYYDAQLESIFRSNQIRRTAMKEANS